ncbi:putative GED domain-containing protein [Seiridium unicorne]|uniref:GED domain-containing protein n=1 Tax=Seiridium unicorne TaxID=138068 RepID=A0ABR2UG04_9PEZI
MKVRPNSSPFDNMSESTAMASLAGQISEKTSGFIQSSNHRDLLDIVDSLRSHGVSHYVDLPQIIVCGSQSSGKSSTLEAISSIPFPTAEGLCTRFATELILRRGDRPEIKVHIQPAPGRTEAERIELSKFSQTANDDRDFPQIVEAAKAVMGLSGDTTSSKVFSSDVLRIESTSPTAPNLTLVDLPGLFGASDKNQSDDDAAMVQNMILSYMKQRRSIILAVVSADNPFANQPVTKFARDIDPTGTRTLGLITKPDRIDSGSDSEKYYVELAQNQNVKLHLGWHVLRNRGHATAGDSNEQRDEREAKFFEESVWNTLDQSQLGVESLRGRLRDVLWKHIQQGLSGVKSEVQAGIKECKNKLGQLGKSRSTQKEKHTYLHRISSRLSIMIRAAIDGVYSDPFFESYPNQEDAFDRRLRAHVQAILTRYSEKMCRDGHALEVVEADLEPIRWHKSSFIRRGTYLKEVVKILMVEGRGRELPGTFNPLVIGDLFSRQCKPWESITQNLVEQIHEAAATTFNKMISEICDVNTQTRLMRGMIQPSLHRLRNDLKNKVDELLRPHLAIHPITYNDYLTETVQEIQTGRHTRHFDKLCLRLCGETAETASNDEEVGLASLLHGLREGTKPNVEEYSASLAADVAAAYYKVALKKFIDDVSVNGIEACLVQCLPDVFSPSVVWDLSDDDIELLGSEDNTTITERMELTQKLNILEEGLKDLDAFTARSSSRGISSRQG